MIAANYASIMIYHIDSLLDLNKINLDLFITYGTIK